MRQRPNNDSRKKVQTKVLLVEDTIYVAKSVGRTLNDGGKLLKKLEKQEKMAKKAMAWQIKKTAKIFEDNCKKNYAVAMVL